VCERVYDLACFELDLFFDSKVLHDVKCPVWNEVKNEWGYKDHMLDYTLNFHHLFWDINLENGYRKALDVFICHTLDFAS
jgi:hypothetical protein